MDFDNTCGLSYCHVESDVQTVAAICQVDENRAKELLEATNGSIERAIDLHFQHPKRTYDNNSKPNESYQSVSMELKKRDTYSTVLQSPSSKRTKKSVMKTLDSFWGSTSTQKHNDRHSLNVKNGQHPPDVESPPRRKNEAMESSSLEIRKESTKLYAQKDVPTVMIDLIDESDEEVVEVEVKKSDQDAYDKGISNTNDHPMSTEDFLSVAVTTNDCNAKKPDHSAQYPFANLAKTIDTVAGTTKRTIKLTRLKELFIDIIQFVGGIHDNKSRIEETLVLAYTFDLILGKISTANMLDKSSSLHESPMLDLPQPIPLQVSGAAVSTVILTLTGVSRQQLRQAYRKSGDLGDAAADFYSSMPLKSAKRFFVKHTPNDKVPDEKFLSVSNVHSFLYNIATVEVGKGSSGTRQKLMVSLLSSCHDKVEIRFITRMLLGNMRLGATVKTVLAALALACDEISEKPSTNHNQPFADSRKKNSGNVADFDPIKVLQETYNICPRVYDLCSALLKGGIRHAAKACSATVGYPIHPMLADPADSLARVQNFMQDEGQDGGIHHLETVLEWKYDGVRCQAHWDKKTNNTKLFSRHLLDSTSQFPDVVNYLSMARNDSVDSFVIDSEIVAVDETSSFRLLPFQDLSVRNGTKVSDTSFANDKVKVRVYCFDIVYLNGVSLLRLPLHERQAILHASFKVTNGFDFATSTLLSCYDEAAVTVALNAAIDAGAEGLMIKLTGRDKDKNSITRKSFGYEAGARSKLWLKLKRDYLVGYADTIDVVPIGAWLGTGRKAQKGFLSPVLFAVYDDDDGTYRSISRCMSFSDKMYTAMREFYLHGIPYPADVGVDVKEEAKSNDEQDLDEKIQDKHEESTTNGEEDADTLDLASPMESVNEMSISHSRVNCFTNRPPSSLFCTNESPTIWFKPLEVFEVSFADLSLSRAHTAAAGLVDDDDGRGIALRFPRFKRRRPDKTIEQATTCTQIASLYGNQSKIFKK